MTRVPAVTMSGPTKGENTRQLVLDVAVRLFGSNGYQATSVAQIAREAKLVRSAPFAYFETKEDLFLASLDHDAAAAIRECLPAVFDQPDDAEWQVGLAMAMLAAVERHPLAQRVLAGLEPNVTGRVFGLPALVELRDAVAARLLADQKTGEVRPDIDVGAVARGLVTMQLAVLMAMIQLGPETIDGAILADLDAVVAAALRSST